jgi:lactoylglutathione lyase
MKLDHVAIWAVDIELMRTFYEKYFDARSNPQYENERKRFTSYFLTFPGGGRLELMHRPDIQRIPDSQSSREFIGYAHLGVELGSRAAVDALTKRLQGDGFPLLDGPRRTGDGYYESMVADPEGNRIEPEIGPFVEGGDPVGDFEQSCRRVQIPIATFPFTASGFIVHLGRGTLAGVYERREVSNVFFDWAEAHHEPHFQQVSEAQARYSALLEEFDEAVRDLGPEQLVSACRRN